MSGFGIAIPAPLPCKRLADTAERLRRLPRVARWGRLEALRGAALVVGGLGSAVAIGDRVLVEQAGSALPGEVVAFADERVTVMLEGRSDGLAPGARVWLAEPPVLYPCQAWLGRVVDGLRPAARRQGRAATGRRCDETAPSGAAGIPPPPDG